MSLLNGLSLHGDGSESQGRTVSVVLLFIVAILVVSGLGFGASLAPSVTTLAEHRPFSQVLPERAGYVTDWRAPDGGDSAARVVGPNGSSLLAAITVRVSPASVVKSLGEQWDMHVFVDAGTNPIRSADVLLTFTPGVVTVVSVGPYAGGPMAEAFSATGSGQIRYAGAIFSPSTPDVQGTFGLCTIRLRADQLTTTPMPIAMTLAELSDSTGYKYTDVARIGGDVSILEATPTATATSASTATPSNTPTQTNTPTPSNTPTQTNTPTNTTTASVTPTGTNTSTPTITQTPSITPTPSNTSVMTPVSSPTKTSTAVQPLEEVILREDVDGYEGMEDTFIDQWAPTVNYHIDSTLKLRSTGVKRVMFKADVSLVPPGSAIAEAVLTLYQIDGTTHPFVGEIFEVTRPWNGRQATWISTTTTLVWGLPGCDAVGTDRAPNSVFQREIFPTWGTYAAYPFDFNITPLVQAWVNDPSSNQGLMLAGLGGASSQFSFGSSDNRTPELRPRLMIRFVRAVPTSTPTLTPTPTATATDTPLGTIEGTAFLDKDRDGQQDPGEQGVAGVTIQLLRTGDPGFRPTRLTDVDGNYRFEGLVADTYRVSVALLPAGYQEIEATTWVVTISGGETIQANFALKQSGQYLAVIPLVLKNAR